MNKETYNNGQVISKLKGDLLTYYHKDGKIKAQGKCIDDSFEGKWNFYKKEGYLWQVGHFKGNKKHGDWIRYNANGTIQKKQLFNEGAEIKRNK